MAFTGGDQNPNLENDKRESEDAFAAVKVARSLAQEGFRQQALLAYHEVVERHGHSTAVPVRRMVWIALTECEALLRELGEDDDADAVFEVRLARADSTEPQDERLIATLLIGKAQRSFRCGRCDEAVVTCRAIRLRFRENRRLELTVLMAYDGECQALVALGRYEEALALARDGTTAAGQSSARGLTFRLVEARSLYSLGRQEDALATYDDVVAVYREVAALQDPSGYDQSHLMQCRAAEAMVRKADLMSERGNRDDAREIYERAATEFQHAHAESRDVAPDWADQARQRLASAEVLEHGAATATADSIADRRNRSAVSTEPTRYRWVKERPASPLAALFARFIVEPVIGRRGITIASDGVTVHKLFGSRSIPWADIQEVTTSKSAMQGVRIVLVLNAGEHVALPAPTSKTKGDVNGARKLIERRRAAA